MQKIDLLLFNREKVVKSKDFSEATFKLSVGFALIIFFSKENDESTCFCFPLDSMNLKDRIAFFQKDSHFEKRESFEIKLLYSGDETHTEKLFDKFVSHFESIGFKIEGKAFRIETVKGQLFFNEKRLRIEKASETRAKSDKIKVLIVDDSKTIRDLLTSIFSKDPELEIVGVAEHPKLVENLIVKTKPDVITLDIHMPDMDGVTLLKRYLPKHPIPTVMISSITLEDGPFVLNALEFGAVDYIQKPSFSELSSVAPLMIEKIKAAARSKIQLSSKAVTPKVAQAGSIPLDSNSLIVIGSSTGGTEALKQVFTAMPSQIPATLVVQHIPPVFSKAFADRMNQLCPFDVKEAENGDLVKPNQVLIAPGGFQMALVEREGNLYVKIEDAPPMNRHKPSVDYLFDSVAKVAGKRKLVGAILTGMGADGARGLKVLRDLGARTVAQDEATSVVYGMPKEAFRMGGAEVVLPLGEIAHTLISFSTATSRARAS